MSIIKAHGAGEVSTGFYSHNIGASLRFDDASTHHLKRTEVAGNRDIFSFSTWIKRSNIGSAQFFMESREDDSNRIGIRFDSNNKIEVLCNISGSTVVQKITTQVFRDIANWYNIVLVGDTTESSQADRIKLYVNGSQVTSFATNTNSLGSGTDLPINKDSSVLTVGAAVDGAQELDGYMADVNFIDGTALTPASFGETKSGVWIPKDTSGLTFGNNGFRLEFGDSTAIGDDTSGEGHDYTVVNLSAHDVMVDSPTNNFCTINKLDVFNSSITTTQGNLTIDNLGATTAKGTFEIPETGKYYFEVHIISQSGAIGDNVRMGIAEVHEDNSFSHTNDCRYISNGTKNVNGSNSSYGATIAVGDTVGVAINADDNEVTFFKNGASQGAIAYTINRSVIYVPFISNGSGSKTFDIGFNFGADSTFAGTETAATNTDETGTGVFNQAVPSGFSALCSVGLPDVEIIDGSEYFNTVLYEGDGSVQAITGVGFQPDWVWIKNRDANDSHNWTDSVRGVTKQLDSNSKNDEATNADGLTAFGTDGFTVGDDVRYNTNNESYASWNWLAPTAVSGNTSGSGTAKTYAGRVSTESGFSIISYVGNNTSGHTIPHELGVIPKMIIFKNRDANSTDWRIYHRTVGAGNSILLDTPAALFSSANFASTFPTSSVFTVGTGANINGNDVNYIAYCFAPVEGFSRLGFYKGNSANDGTYVHTGFRPAFVMQKVSSGGTGDWLMYDNKRDVHNEITQILRPSDNAVEGTGAELDFLSNGFKLRGASTSSANQHNTTSDVYIYMAFAEMPFKFANAR